jgi:hypothetical protein
VVKRPRLALTPNAKIATKLRQNYLDGFIDEHIKMNTPPEEAYQKVWLPVHGEGWPSPNSASNNIRGIKSS